jgi:hypothetical protein
MWSRQKVTRRPLDEFLASRDSYEGGFKKVAVGAFILLLMSSQHGSFSGGTMEMRPLALPWPSALYLLLSFQAWNTGRPNGKRCSQGRMTSM